MRAGLCSTYFLAFRYSVCTPTTTIQAAAASRLKTFNRLESMYVHIAPQQPQNKRRSEWKSDAQVKKSKAAIPLHVYSFLTQLFTGKVAGLFSVTGHCVS
ncbi:hypothetical protein FN846DRAFT_934981 [Sphaerosporella brunnea]|uniref:Uncharacterized protein n=1 Tax=Sphaerosporella brunnea TaxID=1250544 RepID=A0A5J5F5K0_9PEZI|nr:hypothetical protein FN846DRAFT_934935 [Sphaerosporella brunnea]KAA8911789.1 hypothetical protein FN846DRAFT_934981 [Sphaerosporella brunnea]